MKRSSEGKPHSIRQDFCRHMQGKDSALGKASPGLVDTTAFAWQVKQSETVRFGFKVPCGS